MGGIVTTAASEGDGSLRVVHHVASNPYTMATAPCLPYQEVKSLLPLFASSWNDIMSSKTAGCRLSNMFQISVIEGLKSLGDEGSIIDMLLRSSSKKHWRASDPVVFIMRYCIKSMQADEADHVMKLQMLGREHSRIGVTDYLIAVFCEVLLQALARCLVPSEQTNRIIHAWAANFRYIITLMTNRRFSFLRPGAPQRHTCVQCGEDVIDTDAEICNDCMQDNTAGTKSTNAIMFLNHDGLDHGCHSIPEIGSTDSVTVKYRREHNNYDLFIVKSRLGNTVDSVNESD
jgi:hypothetical protein